MYLAEYLVIGLAAAGTGLATGRLAAPPLTRPGAGPILVSTWHMLADSQDYHDLGATSCTANPTTNAAAPSPR